MKQRKPRRLWLQYLISGLVALLIAGGVAALRGFAPGLPAYRNVSYLSDGFFVAGLMLAGLGGLIWISTTGFFDILSYGARSLLVLFTALRDPKEHVSYYDYKAERDARRGKTNFTLLVVGVAFLLLSLLCLWLYYRWLPA